MDGMHVHGGMRPSMGWSAMGGDPWLGAAASFLAMWVVMTVAMMLPSLAPTLWRYRRAVARSGAARSVRLTALVGLGYFTVWTLVGVVVYPLSITFVAAGSRFPSLGLAVPLAGGVLVLLAAGFQFMAWKARHLARCREAPDARGSVSADGATAWRHGLRLGRDCSLSCAGLMAILLVVGAMDLLAMAAVTAVITIERLAPAGERVARIIGVVALVAGTVILERAVGAW